MLSAKWLWPQCCKLSNQSVPLKKCHKFSLRYPCASLQWHHMSVMVSQITSNSTVWSTTCSNWQGRKHFILKWKCCYFVEVFVTGCTERSHFDCVQCSQNKTVCVASDENLIKMMTFPFQCNPTLLTLWLDGILPKGPYLPCLRMADRAL